MTESSFASENSRNFPSSLPIRSPSPDTKASNKLNRTISPTIELRNQQQTSPKSMYNSRRAAEEYDSLHYENQDLREQLATLQLGGGTFSSEEIARLRQRIKEQDRLIYSYKRETEKTSDMGNSYLRESKGESSEELRHRLHDKERMISELKKILTTMSDSSPTAYHSYGSPIGEEYRERVRMLEVENEKLSDMVRKLNRRDANDKLLQENKMLGGRVQELLIENNELEQKIERFKRNQTEQMVELTKINNALTGQIKHFTGLEEKNRSLERENERLMRMLKESQKGATRGNLEEELARLQNENRTIKERASVGGPEKLSIAKIKQQYNENIKIFKQTVYEEVYREFEKFETTIKHLHGKLDLLEQRTSRMEHTERNMTSPDRELSPIAGKMHKSMEPADYESPPNRQTKKKPINNAGERFFEQTHHAEVKSQPDEDPEMFRLQAELQLQTRQKNELSEKYNQLTADYNSLNQVHMNSLQDIQRYLLEIKRLKESFEEVKHELHHHQSHVEQVTQHKIKVEQQHQDEVTRVRQNSATQADRIRLNYQEKLEQLRTMTEDQINRLNDTYNQEIIVLRQNIEEKTRQLSQLERLVRARELKLQQQLSDKQLHISKLQKQLRQHQHRLTQQESVSRDFEEKVQTRTRSYTVLENNYQSLKDEHERVLSELKNMIDKCELLRQEKDLLQAEHRQVAENLREASNLALQQMQTEHERNKELVSENGRLEQRARELANANQELQDKLAAGRLEAEEGKNSCNKLQHTRQLKIDELIRQAEEIKAVMSNPEANAVIDGLLRILGEFRVQRDNLSSKLTSVARELEISAVRHRAELLSVQKQNKLLQLRLETVQKQLEIRLAESEALRGLLDQRVRTTEEHALELLGSYTATEVDTTELETIQNHYIEGLQKLQHLIKELEAIRSFELTH